MASQHKYLILWLCLCLTGCTQDRRECAADTECFGDERCDSAGQCVLKPEVEQLACDLSACESELTQEVGCFGGRCEVRLCKEGAVRCEAGCCLATSPTTVVDALPYNNISTSLSKRVYDAQGAPHLWAYDPETKSLIEVFWDGLKWRSQVVTVYPSTNGLFEITYDSSGSKHLAYTAIDDALYYAKIDEQGAWTSEQVVGAPGAGEVHLANQIVVNADTTLISFLTGSVEEVTNQVLPPGKPTLKIAQFRPLIGDWNIEPVPTEPLAAVNKRSSMLYTPTGVYIAVTEFEGGEPTVRIYRYALGSEQGWRELISKPGFIDYSSALTLSADMQISLLYADASARDRYELKRVTAPAIASFAPSPRWSEVTLLTQVPDSHLLDTSLELSDNADQTKAFVTLYNTTTSAYEVIALSQPPESFAARRVLRDKLRCQPALGYFNELLFMLSCDERAFVYLTQTP